MATPRAAADASRWVASRGGFTPADIKAVEPDARRVLAPALAAAGAADAFRAGRVKPGAGPARAAAEAVVLAARASFGRLGAALASGAVNLTEWFARTLRGLAARSAAAAMAVMGTKDLLDPDRAAVAAAVDRQGWFLGRFRRKIESLAFPLAGVARRAALYADSLWGAAWAAFLARSRADGRREGRRVLGGPSRHCPDCPPLAALGWAPLGEVVPIGETACGQRCHCYLAVR